MNKKKFFMAILLMIALCSFASANLNFTSVALTGTSSKGGVPFYYYGTTPTASGVYATQGGNVYLLCSDSPANTNCRINATSPYALIDSGCFLYGNGTSSPRTGTGNTRYRTALANVKGEDLTIYCHMCNSTGTCDNTTFTGSNQLTVRYSNMNSLVTTFMNILGLVALSVIVSYVVNIVFAGSGFKYTKEYIAIAFGGFILVAIAVSIITTLTYGW